ncbi:MAG: energy transducer TonB [Pseudomonadales bacterium]|nr:energy transducer TonB [Pseudomonadales bacterium]
MLQHDPAAKTHSRLGFTLTMAIALHVAVVLGVGFAMQIPTAPSSTRMDITLSNYKTDKEVLDADFVAQTNQEASGSESVKKELTTTEFAEINSATINKVQPIIEMPNQQRTDHNRQRVTSINSQISIEAEQKQADKNAKLDMQGEHERLQRHVEMASLQAKLDELQQVYARLPRIRRSTSVATKAASDAEYLYNWQQRIETIGNQHYPQAAREQDLYGNVILVVDINSDGSLNKVKIGRSSGNKLLDDSALKIVRLAAPFAPFPAEMKMTTDIFQIIRIWQFRKNRFSDHAAENE